MNSAYCLYQGTGHGCFWQGFILAGDKLVRGSMRRTDLPGVNFGELQQIFREQLFVLPDETIVYTGDGPISTMGFEKRKQSFFHYWANRFILSEL